MKPLLLTFDLEEFDWVVERGRPLLFAKQVEITTTGLERILPVLRQREVPATFFSTVRYATAASQVVRELARAGHEVGVHGMGHQDAYGGLSPDRFRGLMQRAREDIAATAGTMPTGFRSPHLQPFDVRALAAAGYRYDATPHPTFVPGRYNGLGWPRRPWREEGLIRVPISVLPVVRLPLSWIWFRWAGLAVARQAARLAVLRAPYLHLYFHPWEAVRIGELGMPPWYAWRCGEAFVDLLSRFLDTLLLTMRPMTVKEFLDLSHSALRS